MSTLLAIGLANAVCAAFLAIPAYLAGRRGRPALAHALWLLVLVKLVTPPVFPLPLPFLPAEAAAPAAAEVKPPEPAAWSFVSEQAIRMPLVVVQDTGGKVTNVAVRPTPAVRTVSRVVTPAPQPTPEPAAPPPPPRDSRDVLPLLLLAWLAGGLFCVGRSLVLMLRFQRLLQGARLAPEALQHQARALAEGMGLRRCPAVWLVPGSLPPMVWALGRACILFPAGLLDRLGEEERASLLAHELAHVRRRDHLVRWLELVVLGLFWWYPLAWWARKQLQAREEECCDAWAAGQVAPRIYAGAILEAIDFLAEARPRVPALASPLAAAESLRERLTLIMTAQTPRRLGWRSRLACLGLAVAVLPLLPSLTRSAAPPDKPAVEADEPADYARTATNLLGGTDESFTVAFSPSGKHIAAGMGSAGRPGQVMLWDFPSRKLLWSQDEARGIGSVNFSPDSKRLAYTAWGGLFRVEDIRPRRTAFRLSLTGNNRVAYSGDGKWMALARENRDKGSLRLLDALTGKQAAFLEGDSLAYYCVSFSRSSKLLAAGGGSFPNRPGGLNQVNLFDLATRKQVGKLTGHNSAVLNVAFAPKDALVATSSVDASVRIYDGKTFQFRTALTGHANGVKGLAFSPDGSLLATGSWDRTVRLWNPQTGEQLAQLEGHPGLVREVAFSPDGRYLVSGGSLRSIKVWDVKQRKELATLNEDTEETVPVRPLAMAVSADGKLVATGADNGFVQLIDSRTGRVRQTLKGHADAVTALVFSRDSKYLATSGPDMTVRVWAVGAGKPLHTLEGHKSWIYSLAFSPDGKTLASGSYDRTVRLWDPLEGTPLATLTGHKGSVRALAFSPDGALLASGGADKLVGLWDVKGRMRKALLQEHNDSVRAVTFAPGGKVLVTAGEDGQLLLWDPVKGALLGRPKSDLPDVVALRYTPSGRVLVAGGESGRIALLDGRTGAERRNWVAHGEGVRALAFGAGGQPLYSLGGDGLIKVWVGTVPPLRVLQGHKGPVRLATYSPDGKYLLSCSGWPQGDRTLRLWEVDSGKEVRILLKGKGQFQSAAFSPDGKLAAAGEDTGLIRLVEVETGNEVRQLKGHASGVPDVAFSKDGKQLLSASSDKTVRLWDVDSGEEVKVFHGHTDWARCAVFHPDGKRILSGGRDKVIRIWDLETGKNVQTIDHAGQAVERIVLLPGGRRFLASGGDSLRLYDLQEGKELRAYPGHQGGTLGLAVTKDGRRAFSTGYDNSTRMWDVASGTELQRFSGHREWVWTVNVSPDGKTFATAGGGAGGPGKYVRGSDHAIRVWRMPAMRIARQP